MLIFPIDHQPFAVCLAVQYEYSDIARPILRRDFTKTVPPLWILGSILSPEMIMPKSVPSGMTLGGYCSIWKSGSSR